MSNSGIGWTTRVILFLGTAIFSALSAAEQPTFNNERVTVSDVQGVQPPARHDFVSISLSHPGTAVFGHRGEVPGAVGVRTVIIELKDQSIEPLVNPTRYPLAFPRPYAKKLLENDRVVVWQYTWHAGQPTPMHFHDKDAVSVSEGDGAVKSTSLQGESSVGTFKVGDFRYNLRARVHTEVLASGNPRAVIVELK